TGGRSETNARPWSRSASSAPPAPRLRAPGRSTGAAIRAGRASPSSELLEEAQVVLEVQAQIGDAVAQHRDPLDPHAKREAGDALGVIAVFADVGEHVR